MQQYFGVLSLGGLCPVAHASLRGSGGHPEIIGAVRFYPWAGGTLVRAEVDGLPDGFFALHIHAMGMCESGGDVDFASAGGHFDLTGQNTHPNHSGDLPNLLSSGGKALLICYTGRFQPHQVLGRAVMIHEDPDDGRTDPAGNAGGRIACGVIRPASTCPALTWG